MAVQIHPLIAHGAFSTYGYFVIDDETNQGFLIDPGAQPQLFLQAIRRNGWDIRAILLTHGHFDHTGAVGALRAELGIPAMAHELADRYLLDAKLNLSASHGCGFTVEGVQKFGDGDSISLGGDSPLVLQVLHVPGHTDDSCVFYCGLAGAAFVGDTVYEGGPGLTLFPTGDDAKLRESIERKLYALSPDTLLLSGHSAPMTVDELREVMALYG